MIKRFIKINYFTKTFPPNLSSPPFSPKNPHHKPKTPFSPHFSSSPPLIAHMSPSPPIIDLSTPAANHTRDSLYFQNLAFQFSLFSSQRPTNAQLMAILITTDDNSHHITATHSPCDSQIFTFAVVCSICWYFSSPLWTSSLLLSLLHFVLAYATYLMIHSF